MRRRINTRLRPAGGLKFDATALSRDHLAVQVRSIDIEGIAPATTPAATKAKFGAVLPFNEPQVFALTATVGEHQALSQPYWLAEPKQGDTYTIPNQLDVGLPENPPLFNAHFHLRIESEDVEVVRPVEYRYIERGAGRTDASGSGGASIALQWSEAANAVSTRGRRERSSCK